MSCERDKTVIVEAAAAAEVGPPLRLHLEGCSECRAAFASEQSLFSAIDASLSQRMSVSPSPEFLPRIQSTIDVENLRRPVRTASVWFRWLPRTATATAVLIALLFAARHHSLSVARQQPDASVRARGASQAQTRAQLAQPERQLAITVSRPSLKRSAKRGLSVPAVRGAVGPEILVPPDERDALAHFVAGLSQRREVALALARPVPYEPQPEASPGGPLQIAKLEVPPLIPVNQK